MREIFKQPSEWFRFANQFGPRYTYPSPPLSPPCSLISKLSIPRLLLPGASSFCLKYSFSRRPHDSLPGFIQVSVHLSLVHKSVLDFPGWNSCPVRSQLTLCPSPTSMVLIALITHLLCAVQFCKHLRYKYYDMQIQVLRNRDIKWISEGGTFGSGARIWTLLDIFQSFVIYPHFLAESNEHIGLTWPIFTYKQTLLIAYYV